MPDADPKRNVLLRLAAEGVVPVLGGCAGALAGGPVGGVAGVAVGQAVERAINLFGRGIVERWRAWFAHNRAAADAAVAALAALPPADARAGAASILLELAPEAAPRDLELALDFLSAIPPAVTRALAPATPGGRRPLPPTVSPDDARSLLQLLPEDPPPYPAPADLPGTPYRLVELVGAGGFGAVYRATAPTLQHLPLAIKFCLDRPLAHVLARERSNLERLMRAGGPGAGHVVRLYGYDLDHPTPYLVYEYVAGGTLARLVAAHRPAPPGPDAVRGWVTQIAAGLAFAHRAGVVHRDLKPANVLVRAGGGHDPGGPAPPHLMLADFGMGGVSAALAAGRTRGGPSALAAATPADLASLFRGAGTPLYMSPEQRAGADPDPRHDLYSLGVVWYQLLTGDVARELHPGWAQELTVRYAVPPADVAALGRCVGWFDDRPRDATALLDLLRPPADPRRAEPLGPPPPPAEDPPGRAEWAGSLRDILADGVRKRAFLAHTRTLLQTVARTDKNVETFGVLRVVFPAVFGGIPAVLGVVLAATTRGAVGWVAVPLGLLAGAVIGGLFFTIFTASRKWRREEQTAAVGAFAAMYPAFTEQSGGADGLRNQELMRSILLALDDLPQPGLFRRLFGP